MRRSIVAIALLFCTLASVVEAQSQRRPPQVRVQQPEATVTQENTKPDQRGTEQEPIIVKIAPSPKSDEDRAAETAERQRITDSERKKEDSDAKLVEYTGELAFFTKALFLVTGALFLATTGLLIAAFFQFKDTRKTIELARDEFKLTRDEFTLARDEFLSTHRPKIIIKHVWLMSEFWPDTPIVVKIVCINGGTTEARITEVGIQYFIIEEGRSLPVNPEWKNKQTGLFVLTSGTSVALPDWSERITDQQHSAVRTRKAKFYCAGYIHYLDGANRNRTTAFCRQLIIPDDPASYLDIGPLVKIDHPDYEYNY
jgi:hypothetical protein